MQKAFHSGSKFSTSSILTIDRDRINNLRRKLDPISDRFFDNIEALSFEEFVFNKT